MTKRYAMREYTQAGNEGYTFYAQIYDMHYCYRVVWRENAVGGGIREQRRVHLAATLELARLELEHAAWEAA